MIKQQSTLTRRQYLGAAAGAGTLVLGLGANRSASAAETIRQGYQTNIWGMPTYYLMKSGYLEKHGIAAQDFAVPSGNITMQQMVAGQVDLGTYAGPSFIIGNVKGGLVAIAVIENVGKTARVTTRKDLNITKPEQLRGKRIANLVGSSVGNDFDDIVMPHFGIHKGDFTEIRMDITNMVAALSAKTVDAMVNVEPYNVIAVSDGIGNDLLNFSPFDPMPVFMAATARCGKAARRHRRLSQGVARCRQGLQERQEVRSTTLSTRSTPARATRCRPIPSRPRCRASRSIPAFPISSPTCRSRPKSWSRTRPSRPSRTGARRCARISWKKPRPGRNITTLRSSFRGPSEAREPTSWRPGMTSNLKEETP